MFLVANLKRQRETNQMKRSLLFVGSITLFVAGLLSAGTTPKTKEAELLETATAAIKLENATDAIIRAFDTHPIVMLGEIHGNKEEYQWLRALVGNPKVCRS